MVAAYNERAERIGAPKALSWLPFEAEISGVWAECYRLAQKTGRDPLSLWAGYLDTLFANDFLTGREADVKGRARMRLSLRMVCKATTWAAALNGDYGHKSRAVALEPVVHHPPVVSSEPEPPREKPTREQFDALMESLGTRTGTGATA